MRNETVVKEGGWVWPKSDKNSWEAQNEHSGLAQHVLPYVVNKNVMVQAGGNCGFILNTFINHFNTVYTFEPDPINFYCLNQNITASHVFKMQACLGESKETVNVQQLVREGRLHDTGGVHVSGVGVTPTLVIDDLNLTGCGLIQLDIEGYELKALRGAIKTIKKYKPVICVELCEKWLNRYETTSDDVYNLLQGLNYTLVDSEGVDKIFIHNEL
jgi:FkbM family methyltransferase